MIGPLAGGHALAAVPVSRDSARLTGHLRRFSLEQATLRDDADLRHLLRSTPMDGPIRLCLQREPDFFAAARIGNDATQVIVGRELATGHVASTATRAIRRAFVNGQEGVVGYLSSLRVRSDAARTTLLARGYRYLRELHSDARVQYYVTTILEGNSAARHILTSERAGLPLYVPVGRLQTYLVPLYKRRRSVASDSVARGAAPEILPPAFECLNAFNTGLQFAPVYRPEDLGSGSHLLPGLTTADLFVYRCGSEIAGTMAVWDQSGLKQTVVNGYSRKMMALRPFLNAASHFGLAPRLPSPGRSLPCLYAALLSSRDSDVEIFRSMLETVIAEHSDRGFAYLLVGLCDRHPFCEVVEQRAAMKVASDIYVVYWRDCPPVSPPSTTRIPHLEIATL
ncbi:hypothetical protein [uncultured Paludibaculum sp.]|uniref:hypothetical protein n=1 Tax=uncultured Paludibaculum sp. TaxID=1765020 RepID=UPI002AAC3B68|nr:hypothetical protein [uncultured Paludibaculum sp.]